MKGIQVSLLMKRLVVGIWISGIAAPAQVWAGTAEGLRDFYPVTTLVAQNEKKSDLDLESLGFETHEIKGDPKAQAMLNERSSSLQLHQWFGFGTLGLLLATLSTAPEGEKASSAHETLGYLTAASYAGTAYLALTAPEPPNMERKGWNIRLHRALVWIHLPGMILTPIAGAMANGDLKKGKKPTGLGKYKAEIAGTTAASLGLAALMMTIDF
ncbi:MAG: hypothetical protein H6624_05470 [Bdellovibrionaceae bacterium]|nr:hypothetical protein [Bdellovibrionales bacterium]MCB9083769.1 hypothetical protein [Pseudobdellovibrionaceae bacterium]